MQKDRKYNLHTKNELIHVVVHRNIKFPRIEFKTGKPVIILPNGFKDEEQFIEKHKRWISVKTESIAYYMRKSEGRELEKTSHKMLSKTVSESVSKHSLQQGIVINKILYKKMKTKWASYSSVRNLTLNTLMVYLPGYLIEYIIFHEMTHFFERKHTKKFWKMIELEFEDYERYEKELYMYWFLVQRSIQMINNNN